jgi:hypothetical protein
MSDNDTGVIKREIKELRKITDNLFEHLGELTEKVDHLGKNVAKMMDSLDFIAGALQDRRQEEAAGTVWLQRHDRQIAWKPQRNNVSNVITLLHTHFPHAASAPDSPGLLPAHRLPFLLKPLFPPPHFMTNRFGRSPE